MNFIKNILTTLTLSLLMLSLSISATPIVTNWDFTVDTAFINSTLRNGGSATGSDLNGGVFNPMPTTLTWGIDIGNGLSSLSVADNNNGTNGNVSGTAATNGVAKHTSTIAHDNNIISGSSNSLVSSVLSTNIFLNPVTPFDPYDGVGGFSPPQLSFNINFTETPNSGICADTTSPIKCNDIFVINLLGAAINGVNFDPFTNTLNQIFPLFEHSYKATIVLEGLGILTDTVCTAAGADSGCIGITTIENQLNSFESKLSISLVPEPSSILLMSLALFGIAANIRTKHI